MLTSNPLPASLRPRIAAILFVSGFCSLVYQVAWFRLARLVFGASTSATAAVVAIFMGGLGLGGYFFGRYVRRVANPLGVYARLELGIAIAAAASPVLFEVARWVYIGLGGSAGLGASLGMVVRLGLATLVLGSATTLMGGTLPAVAQAIEREGDRGRRDVAWLYGYNTLGAVVGALATAFVFIELLGIRRSIWLAALINLLIALIIRRLALDTEPEAKPDEPAAQPAARFGSAGSRLLLPAAAIVGFLFFLMEIVWYRMLAPVLGGSSYTFGLILSLALAGIGLGGLLYALGSPERRPSWYSLAGTCALEAFFLALPFAVGDALAYFAAVTRQLYVLGFLGLVLSWTLVTGFVVLPAAIVAGYQFPLLTALLGSERDRVGHDVGLVYAWNTWGAILGSLAGGFGLLPLLGAPRLWWLAAMCLVTLSLVAGFVGWQQERRPTTLAALLACTLLSVGFCLAPGPSAFWRHASIGAGRFDPRLDGFNAFQRQRQSDRHNLVAEADGVESSVALVRGRDLALLINGKSDGAARTDAATTVMSGMVGAVLHPNPRSALVIGLGTGMTAGWLAAVESIQTVEVVELEPVVLELASEFASVNERLLDSPKTRVALGDGREWVLTGSERFDIIFSEPSNPYARGLQTCFPATSIVPCLGVSSRGEFFFNGCKATRSMPRPCRRRSRLCSRCFPRSRSGR
ncbi:MAG: fused MFS/spermidine synthase [Thermoanaerobaculia bacterium]|nr:fused MFS/spermidine synthase [Thermoanaerobaculia bacterium]